MKCSKCQKDNASYLSKCKYCGHSFINTENVRKEIKHCECGCPVPIINGKGYCVNCKEEVYSFELF